LNVFERSKYLSHESGVHLTLVHEVNNSTYSSSMSLSIYSTLSEGGSLFHIYSNRTTNA